MATNAETASPKDVPENTDNSVSILKLIVRILDYPLMFGICALVLSAVVLLAGLFIYGIHWVVVAVRNGFRVWAMCVPPTAWRTLRASGGLEIVDGHGSVQDLFLLD